MINRRTISNNFQYRTSYYNSRYGFDEEKITCKVDLLKRIDYWKCVLFEYMQPGQTLCLGKTQTTVDVICIIFAALELDINVQSLNHNTKGDLFLHDYPDAYLEKLEIDMICYHHADLADLEYTSVPTYVQQGYATVNGRKQNEIPLDIDIKGKCLHTRYIYSKNGLTDFLIPSLACDDVYYHMCLGYYNLNEGIGKIVELIKAQGIDTIFIPTLDDAEIYLTAMQDFPFENNIDLYTDDDKIFKFDNKQTLEHEYKHLEDLPLKYKLHAKLLFDILNDKVYLLLLENIPHDAAKVKINVINNELKRKHSMQIHAYNYFDNHLDALDLFRLTKNNISVC